MNENNDSLQNNENKENGFRTLPRIGETTTYHKDNSVNFKIALDTPVTESKDVPEALNVSIESEEEGDAYNTQNPVFGENEEDGGFFAASDDDNSIVAIDTEIEAVDNGDEKYIPKKNDAPVMTPRANIYDMVRTVVLCLVFVVFTFTFFVCGVSVDGDSMNNTLENHNFIMISKLFYTPKTGDIVVIKSPNYTKGPLIKRVIGVGGQTITINFNTWEVSVDGLKLEEDYVLKQYSPFMNCESIIPDATGCATIKVEKGKIFVMGDNRNDSLDSRNDKIGQIDESYILGRLLFRVFPFNEFGKVN